MKNQEIVVVRPRKMLEESPVPANLSESEELEKVKRLRSFYGDKNVFDVHRADWDDDPEMLQFLENAQSRFIDIFPNNGQGSDSDEHGMFGITVRPDAIEILNQKPPRKVHTQITIDNKKVDPRNGINQDILVPRIKDLVIVIPRWIRNMIRDPDKDVRHACEIRLQKAILLRGKELEQSYPKVYDNIKNVLEGENILVT